MHDGIHLEQAGVPAVTICTDIFTETARATARTWGAADLPILYTPHPIDDLSPEQLEERAATMLDDLVAIVTGTT